MKNSKILFKRQIKKLFKEGKHIGVLINTESDIRQNLLNFGLDNSEILNDLRYFIEKGYLRSYDKKPDNVEQIALTATGQDWLEDKTEAINSESIKWYYNQYLVGIIVIIVASLILYYIFKIK